MEAGDIGCKEDDEDMKSILKSEDDKISCSLPVNGAQTSKKEDEEDDEDSVLLKDPIFLDFYDSFWKKDPPSTINLKLSITSQLLDQINTLSVEPENGRSVSTDVNFASTSGINNAPQPPPEKLKAANFQARALIIGSFRRIAEVPNDLVVKIYYAKRKLIWEIMYDRLKNKIEIQWADIAAFRAYSQADGAEVLEVEFSANNNTIGWEGTVPNIMLSRPPQFFHEPKSHPRSHTQWKATQDFTNGEALKNRRHKVICAPGALFKDFTRLLQCDDRLYNLRSHDFPSLDSPFFESRPQITNSNDQFQIISPSDHAERPPVPVMNSELSIQQQTTTRPLQESDWCINIQAGEEPRIVYLESEMNVFPDSSQLGNSFGDCNIQFTNNRADGVPILDNYSNDFQVMNNFGNNGQVMNPTTYGNNILAANCSHQCARGSSFPGYEYLDQHMQYSSERLNSMEPFVNQYNGGIPVMHNNGSVPYAAIPTTRIDHVLQPGQILNGSGGLLNRQNVGMSPPVINHSMFISNNYQNNIPYYPQSTPNLAMRDPASANFNPWDRLDCK